MVGSWLFVVRFVGSQNVTWKLYDFGPVAKRYLETLNRFLVLSVFSHPQQNHHVKFHHNNVAIPLAKVRKIGIVFAYTFYSMAHALGQFKSEKIFTLWNRSREVQRWVPGGWGKTPYLRYEGKTHCQWFVAESLHGCGGLNKTVTV